MAQLGTGLSTKILKKGSPLNILVGHSILVARSDCSGAKGALDEGHIRGQRKELGQPRRLEEQDVPAAPRLRRPPVSLQQQIAHCLLLHHYTTITTLILHYVVAMLG